MKRRGHRRSYGERGCGLRSAAPCGPLRWCANPLLRMLAGIVLCLACASEQAPPPGPSATVADLPVEASRVNLVLITVDTLRADRLGCYGSSVATPNFDRLARDGVLFSNASTTVPFTLPAHSSLMTGTYPPFHGVRENVGYYLSAENLTLAEALQSGGRSTAGFVSAFVLDARWGIAQGFEHYHDDFDLAAFESANLGSVQRPGQETLAAALAWLDQRDAHGAEGGSERPFFLWLHLFEPHDPYTPPEPFRSRYPDAPYDAEVAHADALVGEFLTGLTSRDLLDDTAVVLTADHGEGLGDHGETFHGFFVYDSTVHVPLLMRLPGGQFAGTRVHQAVSHVDVMPTLLELVGAPAGENVQGRSLWPAVANAASKASTSAASTEADAGEEVAVYAESFYPLLHYGWSPLRSLRTTRYKLIEAPHPELYDLLDDATESANRIAGEPRVARPLARRLRAFAEELEEGALQTGATADLDEQTLAQLRALGYVAGPGENDARSYDPDVERADPKDKVELHRRLMLAQSLIGDGAVQRATSLLEAALAEDERLLDAHQLLGDLELQAQRPEAASVHFERALALDDRHRPSLFGLATAHRRLGRAEDALLGLRRILELAGQDSKVTLAIADIEVERGDLEAAERALRAAVEPGAPALLSNRLGEVLALARRPEQAAAAFREALERNQRLSQPHFNLAVLAEEGGDVAAAERHYRAAIERAPKHYQAQFNLARLRGRLGDPEAQRELLERSIASKPDFAIGHFFLGKALMEQGQLERAEQTTRAGLEILAESQLGWFVLADILNRRGRAAEAQRALARGEEVARVSG